MTMTQLDISHHDFESTSCPDEEVYVQGEVDMENGDVLVAAKGDDSDQNERSDEDLSRTENDQESSSEDGLSSEATNVELEIEEQKRRKRMCLIKILIAVLLVGLVVYIIVDSTTTGHVRDAISNFLRWIQDNPAAGVFAFMTVYFIATLLFVPGSILTLGAGFVFSATFGLGGGIVLGSLSVFVGAFLGAEASFLLARYLFRTQVEKLTRRYAIFEAIDNALRENGLKIFILLRLSPIIPYNVFNYLGGVTQISFRDYTLALFAILPGTILYVFLGASAGSLTESAMSGSDPTVTIIIVVIGTIFGIASIWLTTRYAKQELNRILELRRTASTNEYSASETPVIEDVNGYQTDSSLTLETEEPGTRDI